LVTHSNDVSKICSGNDIHIILFKTDVSLKLMIVMSGFCLIFMTLFVDKN